MAALGIAWQQLDHAAEEASRRLRAARAEVEAQRARLHEERRHLEEEQRRLDDDRAAISTQMDEVQRHRRRPSGFARDRVSGNDLIGLNFGGERVVTVKRSLLLQFEDTMLARMFSGLYEHQLDYDKDGNTFFDYSPSVIGPLVDFLRTHRDAPPDEPVPPPKLPAEKERAWARMVKFFGMESVFEVTRFTGIHTNVRMADLRGWTVISKQPYHHPTSLEDFSAGSEELDTRALLIGAKQASGDTLAVAAMGNIEVVTAERDDSSTRHHNGVHWYFHRGKSVGFAATPCVDLNSADTLELCCPSRLSWHLNGYGGWRAGTAIGLDGDDWEKVILAARVRIDS